jgi:hypothetical protein
MKREKSNTTMASRIDDDKSDDGNCDEDTSSGDGDIKVTVTAAATYSNDKR